MASVVTAKFDFNAEGKGELGLKQGESLMVLKRDGEWLFGANNDQGDALLFCEFDQSGDIVGCDVHVLGFCLGTGISGGTKNALNAVTLRNFPHKSVFSPTTSNHKYIHSSPPEFS